MGDLVDASAAIKAVEGLNSLGSIDPSAVSSTSFSSSLSPTARKQSSRSYKIERNGDFIGSSAGAGCFPFVDRSCPGGTLGRVSDQLEEGSPNVGEKEVRGWCRYGDAMLSLKAATESVLTPLPVES